MNPVLRLSILERDGGLCQICRQVPATQVDHIVPRVRGGITVPSNLQAACAWCNAQKGSGDAPRVPTTPLAAAVIRRRRALRLSQARLAAKAGLSTATIARVERGDGFPYTRNVVAIAQALDVPLREFFEEVAA